jgi:flagellar FliL protein
MASFKKRSFIFIGIFAVVVIGGAIAYKMVDAKPGPPVAPSGATLESWQYPVSEITTNLDGSSVIEITLTLQGDSTAAVSELNVRSAQVDDAIIGVLHRMSGSQVMARGGYTRLKDMIMRKINAFLHHGKVIAVDIDSIIVQQ